MFETALEALRNAWAERARTGVTCWDEAEAEYFFGCALDALEKCGDVPVELLLREGREVPHDSQFGSPFPDEWGDVTLFSKRTVNGRETYTASITTPGGYRMVWNAEPAVEVYREAHLLNELACATWGRGTARCHVRFTGERLRARLLLALGREHGLSYDPG